MFMKSVWMGIWICLSILCILYGIIVRAVGSGTGFFLVWLALGVIFLLFAFAAKTGIWSSLPLFIRRGFLALTSIAMIVFVTVEAFIISGFHEKGERNLDYIIVLGAQVYKNGPSPVLRFRLNKALQYLEENPDTTCIVTGGQGKNEPFPEADGMAAYLVEHDVEKSRILLERESLTTEENLINCKSMLPDNLENITIGLITSDFHVFRAKLLANKLGIPVVCGIPAPTVKFYLPNNMFREFFAMIKFLLRSAKIM